MLRGRCRASRRSSLALDITANTTSLPVGVRAQIECWPIAVDRVRYVGEPVAIVVATSRYVAEDALDLIEVDYETLRPVVDPLRCARSMRALFRILALGLQSRQRARASVTAIRSSALCRRRASHCRSRSAIRATPARRSRPTASLPNTIPEEDAYDVLSNFMGPFSPAHGDGAGAQGASSRIRLRHARRTPAAASASKQASFPMSC